MFTVDKHLVAVFCVFVCAGSAFVHAIQKHNDEQYQIRVLTVASDDTDGYKRFARSARVNGIQVETLGMGDNWRGGDMQSPGGGYKLNLLKTALAGLESDDELLVLFTDGYDVIYTQSTDEIVRKFRQSGAGVLFGAEHFLWPDQTLEKQYPVVRIGARYLNSGMFIGYASHICALLDADIADTDDDQLFFTRAYLDDAVRSKLKLKLDHLSNVFQNLNGAIAEVTLKFNEDGTATLINSDHGSHPAVVHGNGPSKIYLNNYGNYLAGAFANGVCEACVEQRVELPEDSRLPTVTVAVFIDRATPFMDNFLTLVDELDYPKSKLDLFIYNTIQNYSVKIETFVRCAEKLYANVKVVLPDDGFGLAAARGLAVSYAQRRKTTYLFVIDAEARLDNPQTLRELLKQNRTFIAPLLTRHKEVWSNFWGALSESGFYARSHDYLAIVEDSIRGIWNVPYVSSCYLVHHKALPLMQFDDTVLEPDMALCKSLRKTDIFMHITNELSFGHLVTADGYDLQHARPDFYTMLSNPRDWEQHYIHAEYAAQLLPNAVPKQPCPDVYWFPIVTPEFCADLVAVMETYGKWSNGSPTDERLAGGYEAVPTRDIHMNQVGLEHMWLKFLQIYVRPLQESVYIGYYHNPPKSLMNFVVRYKPTEQPFLKPHHDSSTYTINIALNRVGVDYEGGGCRFLRYNCSVTQTKVGHMLMHPGRLTHYHEGLYVTNGTRYIMISFIDP